MNNSDIRKKPYWLFYYSLPALFSILAIYTFISIFGKNLFCGGDGWIMQYTAAEYAREFWRHVLTGTWTYIDFTIGEGLDPWITMSYYGLTDPMNLLTVPFSHNALPTIFGIITMLKFYLNGVAFGWYASTRSRDHYAITIGSLVYAFSGFFIFWFFCPGIMSAGYLFPLLLYAMDKAFDKKKYGMFAVSTFIAYLTNYYAGAAVSFMLMAYAIIRILMKHKWSKADVAGYGKIILAHVLGILSAAFILLPIAAALSGGSRSASAGYTDSVLWFNWEYYVDLMISMFTPFTSAKNYWIAPYKSLTHFVTVAAPALVLFLTHKTEKGTPVRMLKWCLLAVTCFTCIPFFSKFMNLWMYPTHRWAFAASMVMGMIVVWAVPRFSAMSWRTKTVSALLIIGSACASLLNMYPRGAIIAIITAVITSVILLVKPKHLTAYIATCLAIVMFSTSTFIGNAYGAQFCLDDIATHQDSTAYAAIQLTDEELEEFIRVGISDNIQYTNAGTLLGYNTTTAAWNIMPAEVCQYNSAIHAFPNAEVDWWSDGLDDRVAPNTLAGTKYYIIPESKEMFVPYGFEFYKTVEVQQPESNKTNAPTVYSVYVNNYNPGIGYLFNETLSSNAFEELDIASKQLALMKYAITDTSENRDVAVTTFEVPYIATEAEGSKTLHAVIPEGYEVYLCIDKILQTVNKNQVKVQGYDYWSETQNWAASSSGSQSESEIPSTLSTDAALVVVKNGAGDESYKTIRASRPNAHLVFSNSARTLCLGSQLDEKTSITIKYLPEYLEIGNITLYAMQTSEYITSAMNLQNNAWTDVKYGKPGEGSFVTGKVNAQQPGVFQIAVPYSTGWKAYIDGEETPTFVSGVKYIGVNMPSGEHELRLEYTTPQLKAGMIISGISIIIMMLWCLIESRNAIKHLLNHSKYTSLCRYIIAGCCTTALDLIIYMSLSGIGVPIPVAKFTSGAITIILSFFLNRCWSFHASAGNITNQGWKFIITQLLNISTNTLVNSFALSLCNIKIIAFGFATLAGMTVSFLLQRFWVFNKKEEKEFT